jgi:hypothetical protein
MKKKTVKANPIAFFRKANEARLKPIKASMKRFALGGPPEGGDETSPAGQAQGKSALTAEEIERRKQEQRAKQLGAMTGKQYRQEKKGIKRQQKLDRIASGKQGDRVDNIIKTVGSGIEAVGNFATTVKNTREAFGPKEQKKGGAVKKMSKGGSTKRR